MKKSNPYPSLESEGIQDKKVLRAVRSLPRELFVAPEFSKNAYVNAPLPIACGQTISQPFIVAYMSEKLQLKSSDIVLEIGTGSGFQTSVLAQLVQKVYTIEFHPQLSQTAQKVLNKLGYLNVNYRVGDGKVGWNEQAPFDKIILTAMAQTIPSLLVKQLKIGGKMILPLQVNPIEQYLVLITKLSEGKIKQEKLLPVRFVPLA
ncbi:MAG: protein-L-isoaspartate(D-aspartate) O-methyltransferase [Candidatus Moeniiplasma glomeromycotorum]|nr:protein-L-isoaspartate(D-aspartate) O-methyltransferase [Candidatus Moeniiplasma glomeromycotorum]MCE8167109.1 protein-L-isoaspartate(D-aspartate) O-methyltransferase [Candidatus Moeniiplasma glomeromycotorum]MCE8168879.1 protein-L-isoaspartate(D-aspartate) O-methyltransferase [Candidatus Moeniiplasma glomeromycotorum]